MEIDYFQGADSMRIFSFINEGGPIMYVLLILNIIGFATIISKFVTLARESKRYGDIAGTIANTFGPEIKSKDPSSLIEVCRIEISNYMQTIEKGLNTIKIIASISPLLGLLGTVVGILMSFKVISQTGLSDPSHFAAGISVALITTVGGLIVAIPHFVAHHYLLGQLDRIESSVEKELFAKVL
jgi:biopolymer transport protein ExbB